jgi:long-subunit fatty acid transport protein
MKSRLRVLTLKSLLIGVFFGFSAGTFAQFRTSAPPPQKNYFWDKVKFGGGFGLSVGSGFTDITLAPNAIYNFNEYVSLGAGLQGSYISSTIDGYKSAIYGGSLITLFNPLEQIQLSAELEQVRVNRTLNLLTGNFKDNFWNTGLFFGAGYRVENITVGVRYNVLYNRNDFVYSEAFMPFIRVYF